MKIERIDHLVITVHDLERTCEFYSRVLGIKIVTFGDNRKALQLGQQKLNLHVVGQEFAPKALYPTPGSVDLCLITKVPLDDVIQHRKDCSVEVLEGLLRRTGARGEMTSIY